MKIEFVKDHLQYKAGEVIDTELGLANYMVRVGAAKESRKKAKEAEAVVEEKPKKAAKKKGA